MPSQDLPPADAPAIVTGPGPAAIRRALRGPPGRTALRLPCPPTAPAQRIALALLAEAGATSGGTVLRLETEELLLTEAGAPEAERAAAQLEAIVGLRVARLPLPDAGPALLALPHAVPLTPAPPQPSPAGIEAVADAAPLPALLQREGLLHIAPGAPRQLALMRLRLTVGALAPHLGAAASDPDLARHALDRLRARLLALLAAQAQREALLGATPPVPLLLDLPASNLPEVPEPVPGVLPAPPSLIAALSVTEILATHLAPRRAALRHAGWGLAARGVDAARLVLIAPEALPVDLILLRWSPGLMSRSATSALRRTDPARLALTGCDGPEALEWGLSLGIARFAGPSIEALMAATRMAACRHARACTRTDCAARARAATHAGRAGCEDTILLGAMVPPA